MPKIEELYLPDAIDAGWDAWGPFGDYREPSDFRVEGDTAYLTLGGAKHRDVYLAIFPKGHDQTEDIEYMDWVWEFTYDGHEYVAFGSGD